jgi:hypothetical protein
LGLPKFWTFVLEARAVNESAEFSYIDFARKRPLTRSFERKIERLRKFREHCETMVTSDVKRRSLHIS